MDRNLSGLPPREVWTSSRYLPSSVPFTDRTDLSFPTSSSTDTDVLELTGN